MGRKKKGHGSQTATVPSSDPHQESTQPGPSDSGQKGPQKQQQQPEVTPQTQPAQGQSQREGEQKSHQQKQSQKQPQQETHQQEESEFQQVGQSKKRNRKQKHVGGGDKQPGMAEQTSGPKEQPPTERQAWKKPQSQPEVTSQQHQAKQEAPETRPGGAWRGQQRETTRQPKVAAYSEPTQQPPQVQQIREEPRAWRKPDTQVPYQQPQQQQQQRPQQQQQQQGPQQHQQQQRPQQHQQQQRPQQQQQQKPQQQQQQQQQQRSQQQQKSQQPQAQQQGFQREPQTQGGRGQRPAQYDPSRKSEPSTPGSSPYSMTPSSSASSISQLRDQQIGDTARTLQKVSIQDTKLPRPITEGDAPSQSQIMPQIVQRKGGTECKKRTTLITNYFPLNIGNLQSAIHYDVTIDPDKPKKLFRSIVEEFRKKRYGNRWPAYDGNKNLYSSSPLFDSTEISDTVTVKDDDRQREFNVTIKYATRVDLTCLQNYTQRFRGRHIFDMDKPMQALQCVDVVLRSAPALSCIPVGRSYFTAPEQKYALGDGCILYYGFYQAAILGWKPFVNIDVAHKAFPDCLNLIDLVREMCPRADLNRELGNYDRDIINRHVRQLKVEYILPKNPASRRVYRVNQLDDSPVRATFVEEGGRRMTVAKYFTDKKQIKLQYPYLPTLWVGSRTRDNKILLPFEFCTIMPDQAVNKKMTELQTRNMIRQAATNTDVRLRNIERSVQKANYNRSNTMREFGISVNPQPQEVEARILTPPSLQYQTRVEKVFKGTWRASQFRSGVKLNNWSILCLDDRTRDEGLRKLAQDLMQGAGAFGMEISPPAPPTRLRDGNLKLGLQNYFSQNKHHQMVVVVLSNRSESYNYVKSASEIAVGCLTQCLKPNTVYKLNRSTVENILLKINAKLNGTNHSLKDVPDTLRRPFMIMGADVTHPGPDSKDFPSVAAVTASLDCTAFKYSFEWRLQPSRQEMIEDLEEITRQHLLNFYKKNRNIKPEKILYVRDGVSDGQFVQVLNVELNAIRAACQKLERDYKPSVVFIVVQKRHHTRFFPKDKSISEDKNFNVPAGTCVDTDITHPSIVDFYLVSHASIQGVAKPTKYVKLWDDCDLSEDEIEKIMYYLCHMFARCNRSVSYPAPTYYAHLAAARARVYCEIDRIDMNNLQREQSRLTIKENIAKDLPMFFV